MVANPSLRSIENTTSTISQNPTSQSSSMTTSPRKKRKILAKDDLDLPIYKQAAPRKKRVLKRKISNSEVDTGNNKTAMPSAELTTSNTDDQEATFVGSSLSKKTRKQGVSKFTDQEQIFESSEITPKHVTPKKKKKKKVSSKAVQQTVVIVPEIDPATLSKKDRKAYYRDKLDMTRSEALNIRAIDVGNNLANSTVNFANKVLDSTGRGYANMLEGLQAMGGEDAFSALVTGAKQFHKQLA